MVSILPKMFSDFYKQLGRRYRGKLLAGKERWRHSRTSSGCAGRRHAFWAHQWFYAQRHQSVPKAALSPTQLSRRRSAAYRLSQTRIFRLVCIRWAADARQSIRLDSPDGKSLDLRDSGHDSSSSSLCLLTMRRTRAFLRGSRTPRTCRAGSPAVPEDGGRRSADRRSCARFQQSSDHHYR